MCNAVGNYESGGAELPLVEQLNESSWTVSTTPSPSATDSNLDSVSCPSTVSHTAVGSDGDASGNEVSLADRWNGTTWAVAPALNAPRATNTLLEGVSCASATACTVVGYAVHNPGPETTVGERMGGIGWSITATRNGTIVSGDSELDGVSCATTTSCMAVGLFVDSSNAQETLSESWAGAGWTVRRTPNGPDAGNGRLISVSCPSTNFCIAVGDYQVSGSFQPSPLAEIWNGTSWSVASTPMPVGATAGTLQGGVVSLNRVVHRRRLRRNR